MGYHALLQSHEHLYTAARRHVLLPAAFVPFAEREDRERIDALVTTWLPAAANRVIDALTGVSVAARYVQCVFFTMDVLTGEYDIAKRAPAAVQLIQDAEDELTRERRTREKS